MTAVYSIHFVALQGLMAWLCVFQVNIFSYEEQPISIKSCIVDIAHSYTKRKNVFRMKTYNGSEYLLQAETQEDMLSWIDKIKSNNNPDADVRLTVVQDFCAVFAIPPPQGW